MSKGTKVYTVRIADDVMDDIVEDIAIRNRQHDTEEWGLSEWLRAAIREFSRKRKAGRRKRGSCGTPVINQGPLDG
jgi:hypothetical protein